MGKVGGPEGNVKEEEGERKRGGDAADGRERSMEERCGIRIQWRKF